MNTNKENEMTTTIYDALTPETVDGFILFGFFIPKKPFAPLTTPISIVAKEIWKGVTKK